MRGRLLPCITLNLSLVVRLHEVLDDPDKDKLYLGEHHFMSPTVYTCSFTSFTVYIVLEYAECGQAMHLEGSNAVQPLLEQKAWKYFRDLVHGIEYCTCNTYLFTPRLLLHSALAKHYSPRY